MIKSKYYFNDSSFPTLLLIHGWNTSDLYMEVFIRPFSSRFNIISLDLFSEMNREYTVALFIEEIHQIVEQYSSNNLVIIGHSFGGKLAYFYSLKYPVKLLVLLAPSLIKPHFSLKRAVKVKLYKIIKKCHLPIPKCLRGSKDYQNAKGFMKKTFLNCHSYYLKKGDKKNIEAIVIGFKKDDQVKKYQILKIKRFLPDSKIIMYEGNHFSYLDYVKEIVLFVNEYFE